MRPSLLALGALLSSFGVAAPWMASPPAAVSAPGAGRASFFPPAPAASAPTYEVEGLPMPETRSGAGYEDAGRDRMLVFGGQGYSLGEPAAEAYDYGRLPGQAEEVPGVPVWHTTFEGPWREGRGVRYRVLYKNARGVTWRAGDSFHLYDPVRGMLRMPAGSLPLSEQYAVYNIGDQVIAVVEVENTSGKPMGKVAVRGMQEAYDAAGGAGRPLAGTEFSYTIPEIQPGQTRAADFVFPMVAHEHDRPISFQQTHIRVYGEDGLLADLPQAAIVDPPNWDLR